MSELPTGWAMARLEDLAAPEPRAMTDGPFGSNLKTEHYTDDGPRVIRLQNVGFGEFIDERAHISNEHFEQLRAHEARAGDVIVASLGQDLPRSCLVPPSATPAIVKADCIRVRLHEGIDGRYVNYALQRPELKRLVESRIHGVGRPRLGMAGVRELEVPLAPRAERERIVDAIEEHFSRLDAAQGLLLRSLRRLDQLLTSSRAAAFRTEKRSSPLSSLASTQLGKMLSKKSRTGVGSTPYLRNKNVRWGVVDVSDVAEMDFTKDEIERFRLSPGDVLICEGGAGVGRTGIWQGEMELCCFQKALHRVRPRRDLNPEFLVHYMRYLVDTRALERHLSGVAIGHLPQEDLRALPVPALALLEQETTVEELERYSSIADVLRKCTTTALARSSSLRASILAAAFSGRLVPLDPSDEPASILLELIGVERAAGLKPRKRAAS